MFRKGGSRGGSYASARFHRESSVNQRAESVDKHRIYSRIYPWAAIAGGAAILTGLAAFGQPGVERVLEILRAELILAMQLAGRPSVSDLDRTLLVDS